MESIVAARQNYSLNVNVLWTVEESFDVNVRLPQNDGYIQRAPNQADDRNSGAPKSNGSNFKGQICLVCVPNVRCLFIAIVRRITRWAFLGTSVSNCVSLMILLSSQARIWPDNCFHIPKSASENSNVP